MRVNTTPALPGSRYIMELDDKYWAKRKKTISK
jgi:hypothetical protein